LFFLRFFVVAFGFSIFSRSFWELFAWSKDLIATLCFISVALSFALELLHLFLVFYIDLDVSNFTKLLGVVSVVYPILAKIHKNDVKKLGVDVLCCLT
jgi:hypothetical protein